MAADDPTTQVLAGKTAIVTGAGRGIGRATALAFADAGASVVVTARSTDEIEETAASINAAGGRAASCRTDVTDLESLTNLVAFTRREFGSPTLLVNNAGGSVPGTRGPFQDLDPEAIVAGIGTNLISSMLLTNLVLPGMLEAGEGRIINISSGAAMVGMPYITTYCVAKTALVRFSEALALELLDRGVSVFAFTPGNVLTKLTEGLWPIREQAAAGRPNSSWIFPPGHALEDHGWFPPERAASMCLFLASGKADILSGRFLSAHYDEAEILAHAQVVERDELYTLRVPTLHGLEPSIIYPRVPPDSAG